MELVDNRSQGNMVSSQGIQTVKSFSLAESAHMFRILSDGLYQDKIAAVLREVGCNAADAHIEGGIPDTPIEVKLPTSLDKSFYIKDFGPGLSDTQITEMYTVYGESTKQKSNDQTGAFGLGSKSPFAYTSANEDDSDGFTVTSVNNGIKRVYTCFILESGEPGIARLYEGPNDDPSWTSGLMVSLPVRSRDISEFHQTAKEVFKWFRITPNVLGLNGVIEDKFSGFTTQSDIFGLPANSSYNNAAVVMGGVRYPIDTSKVRDLTDTQIALLRAGVTLFVPIGTVLMTPSRESLQYTERTQAGLNKYLQQVVVHIANEVKARVVDTEYDTKWEWLVAINEYVKTLPSSVAHNLADYLTVAGMDSDEAESVAKQAITKTFEMPNWVGYGSLALTEDDINNSIAAEKDAEETVETEENSNPSEKLSALSKVFRDKMALALESECRVWMYSYSKQKRGVSKREIIRGAHNTATSSSKVHLRLDAEYAVIVADTKSVDDRARKLVRDHASEEFSALLVAPLKANAFDNAKKYAERLVGEEGVEGLNCILASSIDMSEILKERKAAKAQNRAASPLILYKGDYVRYFDVTTKSIKEGVLSDLSTPEDLWYLTTTGYTTKTRDYSLKVLVDKVNSSSVYHVSYYDKQILSALAMIQSSISGTAVSKILLTPNDLKIKRWKLAESEFKRLDHSVNSLLDANKSWVESNYAQVAVRQWDLSPGSWTTSTQGIVGHLLFILDGFDRQSSQDHQAHRWTSIFKKYGSHPAVLKAIELKQSYDAYAEAKSQAATSTSLVSTGSMYEGLTALNQAGIIEVKNEFTPITYSAIDEMSNDIVEISDIIDWDACSRNSDRSDLALKLLLGGSNSNTSDNSSNVVDINSSKPAEVIKLRKAS